VESVYKGYATSDSEYIVGMHNIAVPIIIGYEPIKYALGVSTIAPFSDYDLKEILKELKYKGKIIASLLM